VTRNLGQRERESLWKMVGLNSLVWEAFAVLVYVAFQIWCSSLPVSAFLNLLEFRRKRW
jgi:fucose permease